MRPRTALLAFLLAAAAAGGGEWKIPRDYRRRLNGGDKAETVVAHFCGGGHLDAEGRSILVADQHDKALPSRVLWAKRGGETQVAYNASKADGAVFVYYGGSEGSAPAPGGWEPKLSLALFTMPLPKGALQSHTPIVAAVRSGDVYGMGLVKNIWHGRNPFGPDDDYASAYIGILQIDKPGRYTFFTASDEASFVLLDGKPLCSWPGRHEVGGGLKGEHSGIRYLQKGQCRIEYYHAEVDGDQFAILGWTPPGEEGFKLVPESAFVHTPVAQADPPERRDGGPCAALEWKQAGQLLHEKLQFTLVHFEGRCRNVPPKAKVLWDYGDGAAAEGKGGDHVYVGEGPFTAIVRIAGEDGKLLDRFGAVVTPIAAFENDTILDENPLGTFVKAVAATDCEKLPVGMMEALWVLVETQEDVELVRPFAETCLRRFGAKGFFWPAADRLATYYSLKDVPKAIALYATLAKNAPTPLDAARCQMERIELVLNKLKKPEAALAIAEAVRATRSGLEDRIAAVKIGDVHRAMGDFDKAEEAYRAVQRATYTYMDHRIIAVRQGGFLEAAASYVKNGALRAAREALVMWEIEQPIGKLSGDLPLMTARYFDALGSPERALAELETLTRINPLSPYLPDIEVLMARSYKKLGETAKARELYDKVLKEYPKSHAAEQARREGL